jgi:hypothetical protein
VAKKSRTPPPPRRPNQGPQRRTTPRAPADDARRTRLVLYGAAGAGLVALAVVLIVILTSGGGGGSAESLGATMRDNGCSFRSFPGSPANQHVSDENAQISYNSFPPTSGRHLDQAAPWGSYPDPVAPVRYVHNLEHGGVVILYGPNVPAEQVDAIQQFVDADPNGMLVAPFGAGDLTGHADLRGKITLGAWNAEPGESGNGRLAVCEAFSEDAFEAFRNAYRGKGPERIPVEQLAPGA